LLTIILFGFLFLGIKQVVTTYAQKDRALEESLVANLEQLAEEKGLTKKEREEVNRYLIELSFFRHDGNGAIKINVGR
jgi:hypothetical protein